MLSAGFVLRVALGCALAGVRPSNWLLLCSSSLALFLSVAKRRADLMQGLDAHHRPALKGYSPAFLDQIVTVSAGLTIMAYALYCMDVGVMTAGWEFASVPFVVFGVLEYLRIVSTTHSGGSPIDVVLSSRALMVCGVAWSVTTLASVSFGR